MTITVTTFFGTWRYDVFLSVCGEDVRVTFMSHFLKELGRKSITTFKDNNIQRSDSIGREEVRAIKISRIAVVVFSENYASSRWCLGELLEIVKCEKELGQLVIPIFYGVDPSDVRKQTGVVGKIFKETCPNITEELKIQWREALTKVANTTGYHSAEWKNEAKEIEKITNEVLAKKYSTFTIDRTRSMFFGRRGYDVFLSFSGEDVPVTFMSHFLKKLGRYRIRTSKDNNIQRNDSIGPELVQVIKSSRIVVVVFSKNYASSRLCLSELLEIGKCEKEWGQLVIPIFYGVDPSDVRKQTGDVGKIFEETCPNITEELKIQWREALTKVANTTGYHSAKWDNEAKMIEEITTDVLDELISTLSESPIEDRYVNFPGLENHIAKILYLLQLTCETVRMVGIWGSSGIGKSTIARSLYSQLSRHFQGSVFIDIHFISKIGKNYYGDNANKKLHLQRNFLSEILGEEDIKVDHLGAAKERLQHQKSLIVIDDLNDQDVLDVLDALAGSSQWFGSGSRIIVVTNDKQHLRAHGISCIYEVGLPSEDLALKIFCRHAFGQSSPPEGFEKLAVEVVRHAGRLPLGLLVLGSSLRGTNKENWMLMMPRIQSHLDRKTENALRISYDQLGNEKDKAIFRHIACLFNLKKVNDIMLLLADSGLDFEKGLRNLVDKSLVNVRFNIVDMHPLLQLLGKQIIYGQGVCDPGEREFLMDAEEICEVFEDATGTQKVLGISLDIDKIPNELYIHKNAFKRMHNLRFLTISSNRYSHDKKVRLHLPGSFDYLPPRLKLLCWDGYPLKSMPSTFRPENLVMLEMKNSKLEKLWEGDRELRYLKMMNFCGSENLKDIPNLSMAPNLEELYLDYCLSWVKPPSSIRKTLPSSLNVLCLSDMPNMVELPFSIQYLSKLTDLTITRCTNLETLPTGINLESLENLNVNGCPRLTTFPDISRNISSLYLEETAIREVPWWSENFSKLKDLQMESCSKLESVSLNISKLKLLELVYFSNCGALTGADWNGYLSGLALEGKNIDTKLQISKETSSSLPKNKVDFRFINCFSLDQEALLQQLSFNNFILSSEEMPSYFTYQTAGSSLTNVTLLFQAPLSPPFFRFRACALVVFKAKPADGAIGVRMKVTCQFKRRRGNHLDPPDIQKDFSVNQMGSHLLVIDCLYPLSKRYAPLAEVKYEHADIQFHMSSGNSKFELKKWGIRVHSTDCSSHEN